MTMALREILSEKQINILNSSISLGNKSLATNIFSAGLFLAAGTLCPLSMFLACSLP